MPLNTSKNFKTSPKVSIVIPTLNSAKVIKKCLDSIVIQKYTNYEILICDGGSTDETLKISKKYNCKILKNKLKTAEAGKAIGLKNALGKYIAFIDSDNILPTTNWLSEMINPLEYDNTIIGSEPWEFTYRKSGGFIERYNTLIGANDPYAYITGISDRKNYINHRWTSQKLETQDKSTYLKITLMPRQTIPTIGANGTVFRASFLKSQPPTDYLFDMDTISSALIKNSKPLYFAKTKNSIIHTYCESSIPKFYKKQMRRLKDYYHYKSIRKFNYQNTFSFTNIKFGLYTILIIPMLITTIKGIIKKPDIAWLFHPIACFITLYCYTSVSMLYLFGFDIAQSRQKWQQ